MTTSERMTARTRLNERIRELRDGHYYYAASLACAAQEALIADCEGEAAQLIEMARVALSR